jgi:hypothetical protein
MVTGVWAWSTADRGVSEGGVGLVAVKRSLTDEVAPRAAGSGRASGVKCGPEHSVCLACGPARRLNWFGIFVSFFLLDFL